MNKKDIIHQLMTEAELTEPQADKSINVFFSLLANVVGKNEQIDLPDISEDIAFLSEL